MQSAVNAETQEILNRLKPHLPHYLIKVESQGYRLAFQFAPFTGREQEPVVPSEFYSDENLRFVSESQDPAEYLLRDKAGRILGDLYEQARDLWRNAAYLADLRHVIQDAADRWSAAQHDMEAQEQAFAYLGTSEAAQEWHAALFRLVKAQERAQASAAWFDERAEAIAQAHRKHQRADLRPTDALIEAGHPAATTWQIAKADAYHDSLHSKFTTVVPLAETVRRRIEQQDNHIAKVSRLSGTAG